MTFDAAATARIVTEDWRAFRCWLHGGVAGRGRRWRSEKRRRFVGRRM